MTELRKMDSCGPFLRFDNCQRERGTKELALWTGSVLYILHSEITSAKEPICVTRDGVEGVENRIKGVCIDRFGDWEFWRFDLKFELTKFEREIGYGLDGEDTVWHFFLPSAAQEWRFAAYSCSGFSHDIPVEEWTIDGDHPLVGHLLKRHKEKPLHVNLGGGDQLYNDAVFEQPRILEWLNIRDRHMRHQHPFTDDLREEAEDFYFSNYYKHFSVKSLKEMVASIPNVMMWDDHDIFDGWGSYPKDLLEAPVFHGIFLVARRFYLLFQHHTTLEELMDHPRDLFTVTGADIPSFSFLKYFGPSLALLAVDIRSERTKSQIVSDSSWEIIFQKIKDEVPSDIKHLIVLFTVPIVYPKVPISEFMLEAVSQINRNSLLNALIVKSNILSSMMKFDEPELLDDLVDHWTGVHHEEERKKVVKHFQRVAREKSIRVTFLSGDVHCAGLGRFYTYPKMEDLSRDPHFMPQVITSAIINAPPPKVAVRIMHRTDRAGNKVNANTREKMVRFFSDRYPEQEKTLARRNFATMEMLEDGSTLKVMFHIEDDNKDMTRDPIVFECLIPELKEADCEPSLKRSLSRRLSSLAMKPIELGKSTITQKSWSEKARAAFATWKEGRRQSFS